MQVESVVTAPLRVSDFLTESACLPRLQATTKSEVLHMLAVQVASMLSGLTAEEIFATLWEREELGSTGIEAGIAIPHGRTRTLVRPFLLMASTATPVDFEAIDDMETDLFFMVLAPQRGNDHLRILARLARLFQAPGFAEQLRYCRLPSEMRQCLLQWEDGFPC